MAKRSAASKPRPAPPAAWAILGLLVLLSIGIDLHNAVQGGAIDLRNRITGARLLAGHIDPYFYKWHEPEPVIYADPYNNPLLPVSKTTATPALLVLEMPLGALPYRAGQWLWLALQWLLLLGTAALWLRRCPPGRRRFLLAAFITGFTYTAAWRLHAERGQAYVLLVFLFTAWLVATLENRPRGGWWTGLIAGVLIALRPPFAILLPFLLLHRRGQLPGALAGFLVAAALPLFWRGDAWTQYAAAMRTHSSLYLHGIDPAPPPEQFPPEIEGLPTDLLANYASIPYADFSLHGALRRLGFEPLPAWPPLALAGAGFLAWLWRSRRGEMPRLLLGVAAWFFLLDLCLPAYRDIYNDVLVLAVVPPALIAAGAAAMPWGARLCFLALPLGWASAWWAPRDDLLNDVPGMVLTLGVALLLFWFNFPALGRKVDAAC